MAASAIKTPIPVFRDSDGNPIFGGKIYIGEPGSDPVTQQKSAYWDEGLTDLIAQPIDVANGVPTNKNRASRFFVQNSYKIAVYDKSDELVYSDDIDIAGTGTIYSIARLGLAGPATDFDVSGVGAVLCDTTNNDVAISGFTGGVTGQLLYVEKISPLNDLTLNHNASTGNQDLFLYGAENVVIAANSAKIGGVLLIFDGSIWRQVARDSSVGIVNFMTITAGTYNALDVTGVDVVFCDTSGGNITINGTVGGVENQLLHIAKDSASNTLTIAHESGSSSNQVFSVYQSTDIVIGDSGAGEAYGGLICAFYNGGWRDCANSH